jgi:hypothetical protein
MRRIFALVLLLAAPTLAACGGGNDSQNAKTSSTTPTAPTGATGTAKKNSGATGRAKSNAKSNAKSRARNKAKNKTTAGTRNGKTKSRSGTRKHRQKAAPTNTNTTPAAKAPARSPKLPTTDKGTYSVARTVCGGYLAETLKGKKLTDLAQDYAHAWPSDRRNAAYDGCLAGLKQPRIPGSDEY